MDNNEKRGRWLLSCDMCGKYEVHFTVAEHKERINSDEWLVFPRIHYNGKRTAKICIKCAEMVTKRVMDERGEGGD